MAATSAACSSTSPDRCARSPGTAASMEHCCRCSDTDVPSLSLGERAAGSGARWGLGAQRSAAVSTTSSGSGTGTSCVRISAGPDTSTRLSCRTGWRQARGTADTPARGGSTTGRGREMSSKTIPRPGGPRTLPRSGAGTLLLAGVMRSRRSHGEQRVLAGAQADRAEVPAGRAAGGVRRQRAHRRRALLCAVVRDRRHPAAVDLPEPEPVVRRADVPRRRAGEPALPSAAGLRLHDLRQVGLPGARLDRHRGRLGLRGPRRVAHAGRLRVRRADAGDVQRHRAADLAGRERRAQRHLRRVRLHRAVPRALRQERDRRGLHRPAVPVGSGAGTRPVRE